MLDPHRVSDRVADAAVRYLTAPASLPSGFPDAVFFWFFVLVTASIS
ncbi:MAG TPA: hypothetical protein VEK55_02450 [Xanthobacteraceae bacterium]|nr:hypothetical protein [Xanthobacteraceae bacterium]